MTHRPTYRPTGRRCPVPRCRPRGGFSLVELLVVIGIIVALMGVLLPALNRAYQVGERTRMALDLQTISVALDAYYQEHGMYPPVTAANGGPVTLCQALIAPAGIAVDGADGPGFRTRPAINNIPQGKTYGPYLPADRFQMGDPTGVTNTNPASWAILDRNKKPILYYPGNKSANVNTANGYVAAGAYGTTAGARPMFNASDNTGTTSAPLMPVATFQVLMGADPGTGAVKAGGTPAFVGNYVLWSSGPDEIYGPARFPTQPVSASNHCDDAANFERSEY